MNPTWSSKEILFPGLWVYRDVVKPDLNLMERLVSVVNESITPITTCKCIETIANKFSNRSFLEYSVLPFAVNALKIAATIKIKTIHRNPECVCKIAWYIIFLFFYKSK